MNRLFVLTEEFERQWKRMGMDDNDLKRLEHEILCNPQVGDVVEGTGKLRKMRFAFGGRGKSGSARVIYVDFVTYQTIYLISAYSKNEKRDLLPEEKSKIKRMIDIIENSLERRHGHGRIR